MQDFLKVRDREQGRSVASLSSVTACYITSQPYNEPNLSNSSFNDFNDCIFDKLSEYKPTLLLDLSSYYEGLAKGRENLIISLMIRIKKLMIRIDEKKKDQ